MKKLLVFFILSFYTTLIIAQPFSVSYTFDSINTSSGIIDPTPVPLATGVTFGSFSAIGTPSNPNAGGRFSFTGWANGGITNNNNYNAHTGTIDTSEYFSVTISPATNYTLSLNDIEFRVQRSGTGIRTYAVRSSIDSFASNLPASFSSVNANLSIQTGNIFYWNFDSITTGQNRSLITLDSNFYNLNNPITFRFYAWNSESSVGTFSVDNVVITGTSSVITTISNKIEHEFNIFPNPSHNGIFQISNLKINNYKYTVYDLLGNIVLKSTIENKDIITIDLSNQENSIYLLCIENFDERIIKKLILNK